MNRAGRILRDLDRLSQNLRLGIPVDPISIQQLAKSAAQEIKDLNSERNDFARQASRIASALKKAQRGIDDEGRA